MAQPSAPALAQTGSLAAAMLLPTAPALRDDLQPPNRATLFTAPVGRPAVEAPMIGDPPAAATGRIQNLLQQALALLGTPYRWGGTSTDGFDCSGLVGYVFRSALGIELPRVSRDMATSGQRIADRASLTPGDLVFFATRGGSRVDHVGIYVGEGRFVHAPRTGRKVTVSSLASGYWGDKFLGARRVAGL